jgi:TonB family protein
MVFAVLFIGLAFGAFAGQQFSASTLGFTPKITPNSPYWKWLTEEVNYIISEKETKVFLQLETDKERDLFTEAFWKARDPNSSTPENEFKAEHFRRLQYADQTFSTPATPGRKTDAGRMYIVLGDAKIQSRIFPVERTAPEAALQSASPWMMKMRIFEAARKGEGEPVKSVTSSYLKYSLTATIKTEFDLAEEMKQLQKTFNNPDVKLLTEADFSWKKNDREKAFHMFRLDSREYLVLITPVEVLRRLAFRIEVFEQGEKTKVNLLDTEFAIPEKNITVFGFEDSKNNAYFLSFRVSGWTPAAGIQEAVPYVIPAEGPVRAIGEIKPPRLIKQVDPFYPEIARQARVEGIVILEAETDMYGRVRNTKILRSIPLLDKAAIDSVKQWIYEPFVIDGKPRGVIFTVTVRFTLDGKGKESSRVAAGGAVTGGVAGGVIAAPLKLTSAPQPKLIKQVDPVYPEAARKARIEGIVIVEATTDIYGRVQDAKALRSIPLLDQAAIDAVKQWVYEPAIIDGKPIPISFNVTISFTLDGNKAAVGGVVGGVAGGVEGGVKGGVQGGAVGGVMGGVVGGTMTKEETRKPAAEGEKLGPVRATGNIKPPTRIKAVDPIYPREAREEGIEGVVILEAETDIYGRVKDTKILRSLLPLDQAAIDAVKQWVYEPFIFEGKPRGVIFTVTVRFTLK